MSERLSLKLGVAAALVFSLALIFLAEKAVAQTACPTGQRPAVATDAVVQTGQLPLGTCYNPNATGINQQSEQAKQDLMGMTCSSGINITGLDSNFAVCADTFMKQLRQTSPGACIRSAYRSVQQQAAACMSICGRLSCPGTCAAPGNSFHQKGLAIDVNYKISNQQAWQIAISSTNGGIQNPNGLHNSDPAHFQASSASCSGAPVPQTDQTDYYPSTLTSAQISQSIVGTSGSLPAGYCLVSTNPLIAAPCNMTSSPTAVAQPTAMPYAPQTALPANYASAPQTVQQLPAQTTSSQTISATPSVSPTVTTTPALTTPTPASSLLSSLLQSSPIAMPVLATPTSTQLFLQQILNPSQAATTTGTSSSFAGEIINILQEASATTSLTASTSASPEQGIASGTYGFEGQPITSTGFVQNNTYVPTPEVSSSPLQQALSQLKNSLGSFLQYLRSL